MKENPINDIKQDGGKSESLRLLDILLLCFSYTLACVYIPLTAAFITNGIALTSIAAGICVVSALVLARAARSFKAIIGYSVILAMLTFLSGSVILSSYLAALTLAASALALLLLRCRSVFVYLIPAIPLLTVAVITRDVVPSLISVAAVPAGIFLAISIKQRLSRVSAICRISIGICIMGAAIFAATVYSACGSLTPTAVKDFIAVFRAEFTEICLLTVNELGTMLEQELSEDYVLELLNSLIDTVLNLLPGIAITLANVVSYVIHATFITVYFAGEKDRDQIAPMLSFDMSLASAIVYILAVITSLFFTSGRVEIAGAVAENVVIVLAPGLVITALSVIRAFMTKKGPSCLGTLGYFGIILMLASFSPIAIGCVALAGAILLICSHIAAHTANKNNGQGN